MSIKYADMNIGQATIKLLITEHMIKQGHLVFDVDFNVTDERKGGGKYVHNVSASVTVGVKPPPAHN